MKKSFDSAAIFFRACLPLCAAFFCPVVQAAQFEAGKLAVLRAGDGGTAGGASDLASKQSPVFIDQFDPVAANQTAASFSAAIPTKGAGALWINGNASTEGDLALAADGSVLTFSGYCGDILSKPGTPSKVAYDRGICVVGPDGASRLVCVGAKWYGLSASGKTNPRGAVSDGANNFWGCGSENGTLFFGPGSDVVPIKSVSSTRAIKIIKNVLYFSITASDGQEGGKEGPPGGIYDFVDASKGALPLPKTADAAINLVVPVPAPFGHSAGFDISPQGDTAYVADAVYGIQKYQKGGAGWKLACSFYIPGYEGPNTGILTNAASTKIRAGCFGLAADFSGAHPVVYATTTESVGYKTLNVNANRLIRLDDTNGAVSGETITNFARTLATAGATNIAFRGLAFTPLARAR
jgi:hypothetical protein